MKKVASHIEKVFRSVLCEYETDEMSDKPNKAQTILNIILRYGRKSIVFEKLNQLYFHGRDRIYGLFQKYRYTNVNSIRESKILAVCTNYSIEELRDQMLYGDSVALYKITYIKSGTLLVIANNGELHTVFGRHYNGNGTATFYFTIRVNYNPELNKIQYGFNINFETSFKNKDKMSNIFQDSDYFRVWTSKHNDDLFEITYKNIEFKRIDSILSMFIERRNG